MSWKGSQGVGLGAGPAPSGLRRRAARWTAGGAVLAAVLGGGMLAAPAAMAAPTIPVPCSTTALRAAIQFSPTGSILVLHSGCVYFIGSALPSVTRDRTIVGSNDTLQAVGSGFTMLAVVGADLQIYNLTIRGFRHTTGASAGAILNLPGADLELHNVNFVGNTGSTGGAILNTTSATVSAAGGAFTGNEATGPGGGGAVANIGGATFSAVGTAFTGNEADNGDGGAINSLVSLLNVSKSVFAGNEADDDGGAVSTVAGVASLGLDGFKGNRAGDDGGAVQAGSTTGISGSTFSLNRAHHRGGGLYVIAGTTTLAQDTIFANLAQGPGFSGGGIYRAGGFVSLGFAVIVKANIPNNCTNVFCP